MSLCAVASSARSHSERHRQNRSRFPVAPLLWEAAVACVGWMMVNE